LVAGLGRAGQAAVAALARAGVAERILAWDSACTPATRTRAREVRRLGAEVELGGDGIELLASAGSRLTVVKSPGIRFDIPLLRRAAMEGIEVIDELELGWRGSRAPIAAVTGTNGKSTTCALAAAVLGALGQRPVRAGNTEFGPPLSAADGSGWLVCEVSSFQLEAAPSFQPDIALFTNLTPEHLDRHGTMGLYWAAKRTMFIGRERTAGTSIVNIDDPFGRTLAGDVKAAGGKAITYGRDPRADVRIEDATWDMRAARMRLRTSDGMIDCPTRLPGAHNAHNVAAAVGLGRVLGLSGGAIGDALSTVTAPPGRWELIDGPQPFDVVVDYAHTPDGIRQVLLAIRTVLDARGSGALRTVFGAVGLRDAAKARDSGRLVGALSDYLTLTTGTAPGDARIPRLRELLRAAREGANTLAREGEVVGAREGAAVEVIIDRRAAIERAVAAARPGDAVAILGLGALRRLILDAAGTVYPFDDREAARKALGLIAA
jgi:UDP-N-acetylmuramoyl-L-alanyl-D-glutamate--2,6-diaminopimelate ligase